MLDCRKQHTNINLLGSIWWDLVVHIFIVKEVEGLEGVKDEVAQILIHVNCEDPSIKAINSPATIHHLRQTRQNTLLYLTNVIFFL